MKGKIFNAQEVQATLNGSKVMFRVVCKVQPNSSAQQLMYVACSSERKLIGKNYWAELDKEKLNIKNKTDYFKTPFQVGETIFVKEDFGFEANAYGEFVVYKSDNPKAIYSITTLGKEVPIKWKPAQHMKQEHSRLTLKIKSVKVERLQDISEEDCLREGIETFMNFGERAYIDYSKKHHALYNARESFATLWNSTHKKPEEKWEASPFVWKVEFSKI